MERWVEVCRWSWRWHRKLSSLPCSSRPKQASWDFRSSCTSEGVSQVFGGDHGKVNAEWSSRNFCVDSQPASVLLFSVALYPLLCSCALRVSGWGCCQSCWVLFLCETLGPHVLREGSRCEWFPEGTRWFDFPCDTVWARVFALVTVPRFTVNQPAGAVPGRSDLLR